MRRVAMGAMALAGLSAYAQADHVHVDECATITADKQFFAPEAGTAVVEARKFDIDYHGAFKVVTNQQSKRQYILYPCGGQPPAEADLADVALPAGFQRRTFSVPAQKAVTGETVSYDFMTQLENGVNEMGVTDRILSLSPYATNACAQKALACTSNRLVEGVSASVPGWGAKPEDYQPLMDAAQVYFDSSEKTGVTGDKSVIFSATSETSLLGRGEWIKFAAAFFNLDHVADKKFEAMKNDYIAISAKAKTETESRPKVLFIDIDQWSNPNADMYTISLAGYKRSAVLDAAGWIPNVEDFSGTGATIPANGRAAQFAVPKLPKAPAEPTEQELADRQAAIATFLKQLQDADIIIDERYASGVLTIEQALAAYGLKETDTAYKAIAGKKWYREDKTGSASGSDWFERGVSRPDLVLKDFIKVIHPELDAIKTHETVFLRDAFAGEQKVVLKPEDCTTNFPICDTSLEAYPDAPICPPTSVKSCADDSKVYLSPASGCQKFEACSLNTYVNKVSDALPASTSITLGVFMAFVALVLLGVGFLIGKKKAGKKGAQQTVSPDARFGQGAQLH